MRKKLLSGLIILSLLTSSSSIVFAAENIDGKQIAAEYQAAIVENVVGVDDVNTGIEVNKNDLTVEGASLDVDIPKEGGDEITLETIEGDSFSIGLPEEVEDSIAVVTDEGTIIYDGEDGASVAVQATQEIQGDLIIESVRSMIVIEDDKASKEYVFDYNLPRGYELMTSEDYYGKENAEEGWIYIVNKNNIFFDNETGEEILDIVAAIEPAWAKDAEGNAIPTYYSIVGDTLIQVVEFDETSIFPIVADPTTSTKPKNKLLTSGYNIVTINNSDVSAIVTLAGFGSKITKEGFKTAFKKYAKKELKEKLEKQLAKKSIVCVSKVVTAVLTAIDVYCAWQWLYKGYTYTKFEYRFEEWKIYKHQGGRWVSGYSHKAWLVDHWGC